MKRKTFKMVKQHARGKTLDIGCGTGKVSNYLFKCGFDVEGCDFNKERLEIAKKNNPKVNYFFFDLNKQNLKKKYDTIILMGVIEYLDSLPWDVLIKLKKNLNVGGRIIFEVPNINAIQRRIRGLFGMEPLDSLECKTYKFTKKRILKTIKKAKFKTIVLTSTKFIQIRGFDIPMINSFAQNFFVVVKN